MLFRIQVPFVYAPVVAVISLDTELFQHRFEFFENRIFSLTKNKSQYGVDRMINRIP